MYSATRSSEIVPAEHGVGRHRMTEVHCVLDALAHLVVHVIGDDHVDRIRGDALHPQRAHERVDGGHIHPVVGVHDLDIHAGCVGDAGVDRAAVALVDLVDCPHVAGPAPLVHVGKFRGAVRGSVIDDQHFDVAVVRRGEQRLHAALQIRFHVVGGHHEGECFRRLFHSSSLYRCRGDDVRHVASDVAASLTSTSKAITKRRSGKSRRPFRRFLGFRLVRGSDDQSALAGRYAGSSGSAVSTGASGSSGTVVSLRSLSRRSLSSLAASCFAFWLSNRRIGLESSRLRPCHARSTTYARAAPC